MLSDWIAENGGWNVIFEFVKYCKNGKFMILCG